MTRIRLFLLVSIVLGMSAALSAQTPQYSWYKWTTGMGVGGFDFRLAANQRWQSIYYPSDFPGAPAGAVANIYVRSAGYTGGAPVVYTDLTVKMGYTLEDTFRRIGGNDSFLTGLTTVFSAATVTFPGADTVGKWVKIPLNAGNFYYDPTKHFVLEITHGPMPQHGFVLLTGSSNPLSRGAGGGKNFPECVGYTQIMEFGFDLRPTGIEEAANIRDVFLYPNPSKGRLTVGFYAVKSLDNVRLSLTGITGQEVMSRRYVNTPGRFSQELDLSALSKGMYFLKLEGDGKTVTRKVILE